MPENTFGSVPGDTTPNTAAPCCPPCEPFQALSRSFCPTRATADTLSSLQSLLSEKGLTLADFRSSSARQAALARANIFAVAPLTTGTFATLDGTPHDIRCGLDAGLPEGSCQIGDLSGFDVLASDTRAVGSVYLVMGKVTGQRSFFQF